MSRLPDRAARRDLKTGYLYQVAAGLTIAAILSAIAYARQHTPGAATKAKPFLSYIRASYNVPLPLWVWLLAGGLVISVAIFSGVRYFERRPASPAVIDFMSPGEFAILAHPTLPLSDEAQEILLQLAMRLRQGIAVKSFDIAGHPTESLRYQAGFEHLVDAGLVELGRGGRVLLSRKGRQYVVGEDML